MLLYLTSSLSSGYDTSSFIFSCLPGGALGQGGRSRRDCKCAEGTTSSYHQYLDVLFKVEVEKLPPHCAFDHHIKLEGLLPPFDKTGKLPPHHACDHHIKLEGLLSPIGVIYYLSDNGSETLWDYISENVEKGFMRSSSSSTGAPVLFVKKKDGGLHLCVDYCKLNAFTRKNRYPFPPMNQLLTLFNSSTIFSKIDLCGVYNTMRIKEGDENLTVFRAKYGSYEYLVMPFG
ncbi:hypothetical protein O181_033707 [Austropuccinia psidii MF-1]|uniref:Reverse transcriptase domain-containing protein n=1 Tax=Austropuccinia psidii MF-1 TaxID=1389203 RepID=A0A9Q3H7E8_9BASI|nr:hypothetical protein [Austropuccinia psidii MF-1]